MAPKVNVKQFGPLYHGSGVPGLTEISQHKGRVNYSAMPNIYGWNFATTELQTAIDYARSAKNGVPTVYEVSPQRSSESWGPDPDSGPFGWGDGPKNKREALDIHEGGGEVSLRFSSPLRVHREVFQEDKARDVTDLYPMIGGTVSTEQFSRPSSDPSYYSYGRSFS